jgi:hypothetical protein
VRERLERIGDKGLKKSWQAGNGAWDWRPGRAVSGAIFRLGRVLHVVLFPRIQARVA